MGQNSLRGKIFKSAKDADNFADLIQKISSDTANNKVVNREEAIAVLLRIFNDTFVFYTFKEEDLPPSNQFGNDYDLAIDGNGNIWEKDPANGWQIIFAPLPRLTVHKLDVETKPDVEFGNDGDIAISPEGIFYQKQQLEDESGDWTEVHNPIHNKVIGVVDGSTLAPTFGNNDDVAVDKALKVYQKQDGTWIEVLTLNAYNKEAIDTIVADIFTKLGDISTLLTTDKTSAVAAINELHEQLTNITPDDITLARDYPYFNVVTGDTQQDLNESIEVKVSELDTYAHQIINDSLTSSTDNTWSITKIVEKLLELKTEILGDAGTAFDTLGELEDAVQDLQTRMTSAESELDKRVAVNQAQTFTEAEKQQGRDNIDVYSTQEVDDAISQAEDNSVSYVTDQSATKTEAEKLIARDNIDVHNKEYVDDIKEDLGDKAVLSAEVDQTSAFDAIEDVYQKGEVIKAKVDGLIDDALPTATDHTYSIDKILNLVSTLKNEILGGASGAYDTLLELQQELQDNDTDIATILTEQGNINTLIAQLRTDLGDPTFLTTTIKTNTVLAINELHQAIIANATSINNIESDLDKRVAVDQSQGFSEAEKQQGRDNIDVYSKAEIGDITDDLGAYFTQQINNL